ncbi:MAG: conjugative transfer signal peptidase TraF [Sphingobium sp.]
MNARRFAVAAWALAGAAGLAAAVASAAGYQLNTTASAPTGLWRVTPVEAQKIRRGNFVSICPPEIRIVEAMRVKGYLHPGDCPGTDTTPLLKPVVAIEGDSVTVSREGVSVNGVSLPHSEADQTMPGYPAGTYTVQPGQVWLISSYDAGSFDSRYFGPVPLALVRGQAAPVLIHGDTSTMTAGEIAHDS